MKRKTKKQLLWVAAIIGATSMGLGWYWFDWKLCVVIFLALLGNNIMTETEFTPREKVD